MKFTADALQSIAITLWVGGLWVIGLIVAPSLFHTLTDRSQAGMLAGQFFTNCLHRVRLRRLFVAVEAGPLQRPGFQAVVILVGAADDGAGRGGSIRRAADSPSGAVLEAAFERSRRFSL